MGFSFGGSKQKSSSSSNARSYVDQSQQPYLDDIRKKAKKLDENGMPVEGVANLNSMQIAAMNNANTAGGVQANAGQGVMNLGANMAGGLGNAMNYANTAMGSNAYNGIGTAMGAGLGYASNAQGMNAAQGGGALGHRV